MRLKYPILLIICFYSSFAFTSENDNCSATVKRLKICFESNFKDLFLDRNNVIQIYFYNDSNMPLRIYFIDHPVFRGIHNIFFIKGKFFNPSKPTPPHGYQVDYDDFHLIPPKGKKFFTQTFYKNEFQDLLVNTKYNLTWEYENDVSDWKGGYMTLDGPVKPLI